MNRTELRGFITAVGIGAGLAATVCLGVSRLYCRAAITAQVNAPSDAGARLKLAGRAGAVRTISGRDSGLYPSLFFGPPRPDSSPAMPQFAIAPSLISAYVPAEPDPLADVEYLGSITVDGRTMALLENRGTHEGWYVTDGDTWGNYTVNSVGPESVSLSSGARRSTLARCDSFSVVPLVADATGFVRTPPADLEGATPHEVTAVEFAVVALGSAIDDMILAMSLDSRNLSNSIDLSVQTATDTNLDGASLNDFRATPAVPYDVTYFTQPQ